MEKKEKPKKKHKKYRDVKCDCCGAKINVDLAVELEDYDYINKDKTSVAIYCSCCNNSVIVKL